MEHGVFFGSSIGFFKGSEKTPLFFGKHLYSFPSFNPIIRSAFGSIALKKPVRDEFIRYFRWIINSRDEFQRFLEEKPETLTDVQRAVRFYCLLRNSYGARMNNPSLNISTSRGPRINLLRIEEELSAAHLRLS